MICLTVCKIKTRTLNNLRLISAKLETAITPAANRRLVATSFCGCVANRAHDPVGSDNMEDARQEIGSPDGL